MYKGNLGGIECSQQLQPQCHIHSNNPLLVLSPYLTSNCEQLPHCPVRENRACHVMGEGMLELTSRYPEIEAQDLRADSSTPHTDSLRFLASRLPPLHVINYLEAGQLASANDLLTRRNINFIAKELGLTGHSALLCLGIVQAWRQHKHVYTFENSSLEHPISSMQEVDARQTELVNLKQNLFEMQQQFDAELKQRDIEKKLLSHALAVARKRLDGKHESCNSVNPGRPSSTLGEHLREEIAAMRLQPGNMLESTQPSRLPSQRTLTELERTPDEIKHRLEQSEISRKQLQEELARLSNERSDLELSLQELRSQLNGDRSIEQMQIVSLQQSLEETQQALEKAKAVHKDQERKLQAVLHETTSNAEKTAAGFHAEIERLQKDLADNEARLSQAQTEQLQWESNLREALEKADQSIDESKAEYKAQIATLQQQLQTQESSRRQLAQDKAELSSSLKDETQRALEFARQAQALDESSRNLQRDFEALQQAFNEAKVHHQNDVALLRGELDRSRQTIDELGQSRQQLDETLQQLRAELQARQDRTQELEAALDESHSKGKQTAEKLSEALTRLGQRHTALQKRWEETTAELAQAQSKLERSESSLQSAIEEAELSAKARQETYAKNIDSLRQTIQSQESSLLKLAQDKAELASRLNTESIRAMEFAGQVESLDERSRNLEQALDTVEQTFSEAEAQHKRDATILNEELGSARNTLEALESTLQQTRDEFKAEQARLNLALETQKQDAGKTESHLNSLVDSLNKQVESIRVKAIRQRKKRIRLETMLVQEQKASEQLKQLMQTTEEKAELAHIRLTEAERNQQEMHSELEKEIKSSQEALERASESEVALQVAKLELASLKDELGQEVDCLRAQLEHLEETRATIQSRHVEEKNRLEQSLEQSETALKVAQVTIRTLKNDRQSIRDANSELSDRFTQLEAEYQQKQMELINALETNRREVAALRQELEDINELGGNTEAVKHLRQELQRANDEKAELKRKIAGLRVVQLEMERHRGSDRDAEVTELHAALIAAEEKRKRAEKLAQETQTLQRERQVQEVAIETLTDDLDVLSKENAALIDERDRLQSELSALQSQSIDDA